MYRILGNQVIEHFKNSLFQSFNDNVLNEKVTPVEGSVLYCDLAFSLVEHSGIYIGNNEIVHLDGSGVVEVVSPREFLGRLNGFNNAISIYVSCNGESAVGSNSVASRARAMVGEILDYNLILNNCHQFSSGCLTDNFRNLDIILSMLQQRAEESMGANTWRVWETDNRDLL